MNVSFRFLGRTLAFCLLLFAILPNVTPMQAQETTGSVEGVVSDPAGAVVGRAVVTLTGDKLIGSKAIVTDRTGYYRFINIDPGTYTLTVTAGGFNVLKRDNVTIEVGRTPSVNLALSVGTESTVIEVSSETPQIDVTQSRTQTNVSREEIDYAPRGLSYQSVIAFAPGARNEPLQGGFQVDGASTAENSYLIEGQETGNLVTGKSAANAPFEFLEEVQVKTSGIDAEYGGALGGVINAVQKKGSNTWHGQAWTYYEADPLDAAPGTTLRYDTTSSFNAGTRTDQTIQFYTPKKDHFRTVQPGVELGGYILKDRLWFDGSVAPQYNSRRRTVNFTNPTCVAAVNCVGVRSFNFNEETYFSFGRLDLKINDKIRLYGSIQYAYDRATGSALPFADSQEGFVNASASSPVDSFNGGIGSVSPNVLYSIGADLTLTPNLIATTRVGSFYQNYGDRGLPTGDRFLLLNNTPTTASTGNPKPSPITALDGQLLENAYKPISGLASGFNNIAANLGYQYNINTRTTFNQDLAYFRKVMLVLTISKRATNSIIFPTMSSRSLPMTLCVYLMASPIIPVLVLA